MILTLPGKNIHETVTTVSFALINKWQFRNSLSRLSYMKKMNSLEKIANEEHFGDNNLEAIEDIPEANQFLSPEPES